MVGALPFGIDMERFESQVESLLRVTVWICAMKLCLTFLLKPGLELEFCFPDHLPRFKNLIQVAVFFFFLHILIKSF